jgi:hypothetical protein
VSASRPEPTPSGWFVLCIFFLLFVLAGVVALGEVDPSSLPWEGFP